jgi:hypothetical protein
VSSDLCLGGSDTVVGCSGHCVPAGVRKESMPIQALRRVSHGAAIHTITVPAVSMLSPAFPRFGFAAGSCVASKNICQAAGPDTACT